MASVNLWELITTVASKPELSNSTNCVAIKDECQSGQSSFGTELRLTIVGGIWIIDVFHHEVEGQTITLQIFPSGQIEITRRKSTNDIFESRTITF